mgnify:CR=1 FL=1
MAYRIVSKSNCAVLISWWIEKFADADETLWVISLFLHPINRRIMPIYNEERFLKLKLRIALISFYDVRQSEYGKIHGIIWILLLQEQAGELA